MPNLSGKHSVVNGISTMRNWNVELTQDVKIYAASNTDGAKDRVEGPHKWSGSLDAYGATPLWLPGSLNAFTGYTAPADGVGGSAGQTYTGNVRIDNVAISINPQSGDIISHVVNFTGDGPWAEASTAAIVDATLPDVPKPCPIKVVRDPLGTPIDITGITAITLTLTAENLTTVNADTYDVGTNKCWQETRAGIIDWTMTIAREEDVTESPNVGDNDHLHVYVSASEYYDLLWGQVVGYTGITVDRETGAIINHTLNYGMKSFNGAQGRIQLPGAVSAWWGIDA